MDEPLPVTYYEQIVAQHVHDMEAAEWHVDGDRVETDALSARDGFLPVFGHIAASNAVAAGLIHSPDQFALRFDPTDDALFGVEAAVAEPADGRLPHVVATLFLMDAVHEAVAMTDIDELRADRRVDLSPTLALLEMSHEQDTPQPSL